jgi:hypothetical protein
MIRVGVWLNPAHFPFGGPSALIVGTLLGLAECGAIILMNEPGDVNWVPNKLEEWDEVLVKAPNVWCGPCVFHHADADTPQSDLSGHITWANVRRAIFPSEWFQMWINIGLPYLDPEKARGRKSEIWGAGVDTDSFAPALEVQKTQDFFVYFKSQRFHELRDVYKYLFNEWFEMKGSMLMYYYYDHPMLREAAQKSRFCIMMNDTETQGLATLEILATDTPIFVIDVGAYVGERYTLEGATSVPCWDGRCGMRSSLKTLGDDFPKFIAALPTYRPREFVLESYSYKAAATKLLEILGRN